MNEPAPFQETGDRLRGATPAWWFGAPLLAVVYVLLTPRILPDIVPEAANRPLLRWFVGILIGAAILATWQVCRWLFSGAKRQA